MDAKEAREILDRTIRNGRADTDVLEAMQAAVSYLDDTATALGRAFSAAREIRDYQARVRNETDENPFTTPTVNLSGDDDSVAECYVTTYWGFAGYELELFMRVAERLGGAVNVHRDTDERIRATLRFT